MPRKKVLASKALARSVLLLRQRLDLVDLRVVFLDCALIASGERFRHAGIGRSRFEERVRELIVADGDLRALVVPLLEARHARRTSTRDQRAEGPHESPPCRKLKAKEIGRLCGGGDASYAYEEDRLVLRVGFSAHKHVFKSELKSD
jgi:hypothetical protein